MDNVVKFNKPDNQGKKNNPFVIKVMLATLLLLAIMKLPSLFDKRPPIYKEHDVNLLENPVQIPDNYIVYNMEGKPLKLIDSVGDKVTILAFWATWCGYCAKEFPFMDDTVPYLSKNGVKIIPIARGDDTPQKIQQFFVRGSIKNLKSVIASNPLLHKLLGVAGYPTFIAVDANGMAFANLRPKWDSADIFDLFDKLKINAEAGKNEN